MMTLLLVVMKIQHWVNVPFFWIQGRIVDSLRSR